MRDPLREGLREPGGGLDAATKRLERALGLLETRLDRRMKRLELREAARAGAGEGSEDRGQLLADLQASRARERALEAIAAEASAALGRAAEEVRAALAEPAVERAPARVAVEGAAEPPAGETPPPAPAGLGDEAIAPEAEAPLPVAAQG